MGLRGGAMKKKTGLKGGASQKILSVRGGVTQKITLKCCNNSMMLGKFFYQNALKLYF